jgi:hypothetical protein
VYFSDNSCVFVFVCVFICIILYMECKNSASSLVGDNDQYFSNFSKKNFCSSNILMRIDLTELSCMADVKLGSEAPFKYVWNYINCLMFECAV